jgi:serine/threonine protein kinase
VKVTPEGRVKVLDFGLAKALASEPGSAGDPESSPTLTIGETVAGVIMGTAAYMAPEQARGQKVDKRADIWAFGVVLYELLTGKRLFAGVTVSDTLAQPADEGAGLGPSATQSPAAAAAVFGKRSQAAAARHRRSAVLVGGSSASGSAAGQEIADTTGLDCGIGAVGSGGGFSPLGSAAAAGS